MVEIVERIEWDDSYPVLVKECYLNSQTGVARVGYFVDNKHILPFIIKKKGLFSWIQLVSEVIGSETDEDEKSFLNDCMDLATSSYGISHISTVNTALFHCYPKDSIYCKWGTYKVDLSLPEEVLFEGLHSKHRNVIRKAESIGTIVLHGQQYAEQAVALMRETYQRQNGKHGIDTGFIARMKRMGNDVDWWIVKDQDGNLQGSAIFVWSRGASCYYMHGGSSAHTTQGAMNLLIWKAMLEMKARGVKCFDFVGARITTEEGSKLEGIQRFKSRFGATMEEGYMFRYICRPVKYFLYEIAMRFYCFLHHEKYVDIIKEEIDKGNF